MANATFSKQKSSKYVASSSGEYMFGSDDDDEVDAMPKKKHTAHSSHLQKDKNKMFDEVLGVSVSSSSIKEDIFTTIVFPKLARKKAIVLQKGTPYDFIPDEIIRGLDVARRDLVLFALDEEGWSTPVRFRLREEGEQDLDEFIDLSEISSDSIIAIRSMKDTIGPKSLLHILFSNLQYDQIIRNNAMGSLSNIAVGWRPVIGDGDCYYRAVYFGLFENCILRNAREWLEVLLHCLEDITDDQIRSLRFPDVDVSEEEYEDWIDNHNELIRIISLAAGGTAWQTTEEMEADVLDSESFIDLAAVRACKIIGANFIMAHQNDIMQGDVLSESILAFHTEVTSIEQYCTEHILTMDTDPEGPFLMLGLLLYALQCTAYVVGIDNTLEITYPLEGINALETGCARSALRTQNPLDTLDVPHQSYLSIHLLLRQDHCDVLYVDQELWDTAVDDLIERLKATPQEKTIIIEEPVVVITTTTTVAPNMEHPMSKAVMAVLNFLSMFSVIGDLTPGELERLKENENASASSDVVSTVVDQPGSSLSANDLNRLPNGGGAMETFKKSPTGTTESGNTVYTTSSTTTTEVRQNNRLSRIGTRSKKNAVKELSSFHMNIYHQLKEIGLSLNDAELKGLAGRVSSVDEALTYYYVQDAMKKGGEDGGDLNGSNGSPNKPPKSSTFAGRAAKLARKSVTGFGAFVKGGNQNQGPPLDEQVPRRRKKLTPQQEGILHELLQLGLDLSEREAYEVAGLVNSVDEALNYYYVQRAMKAKSGSSSQQPDSYGADQWDEFDESDYRRAGSQYSRKSTNSSMGNQFQQQQQRGSRGSRPRDMGEDPRGRRERDPRGNGRDPRGQGQRDPRRDPRDMDPRRGGSKSGRSNNSRNRDRDNYYDDIQELQGNEEYDDEEEEDVMSERSFRSARSSGRGQLTSRNSHSHSYDDVDDEEDDLASFAPLHQAGYTWDEISEAVNVGLCRDVVHAKTFMDRKRNVNTSMSQSSSGHYAVAQRIDEDEASCEDDDLPASKPSDLHRSGTNMGARVPRTNTTVLKAPQAIPAPRRNGTMSGSGPGSRPPAGHSQSSKNPGNSSNDLVHKMMKTSTMAPGGRGTAPQGNNRRGRQPNFDVLSSFGVARFRKSFRLLNLPQPDAVQTSTLKNVLQRHILTMSSADLRKHCVALGVTDLDMQMPTSELIELLLDALSDGA